MGEKSQRRTKADSKKCRDVPNGVEEPGPQTVFINILAQATVSNGPLPLEPCLVLLLARSQLL